MYDGLTSVVEGVNIISLVYIPAKGTTCEMAWQASIYLSDFTGMDSSLGMGHYWCLSFDSPAATSSWHPLFLSDSNSLSLAWAVLQSITDTFQINLLHGLDVKKMILVPTSTLLQLLSGHELPVLCKYVDWIFYIILHISVTGCELHCEIPQITYIYYTC